MQQVSSRSDRSVVLLYAIFIALSAALGSAVGLGVTQLVGGIVFLVALFWLSAFWRVGIGVLLIYSCVDGFIKALHGSTPFLVVKDLMLLSIIGGMVVMLALHPERKTAGRWQGLWAWLLYVGYLGAQALNPSAGLTAGIAGFRAHALFAFLFLVGAVYFTSPKRFSRTANLAIIGISIAAVAGLFQFFFEDLWTSIAPGLAAASHKYVSFIPGAGVIPGLSGAVPRAYGTMVDPAALGLACSVGFLFAAGALARSKPAHRPVIIASMVAMGMALLFSGSRASTAGLAAGLLAFVILSWRHASMRMPAILALVLIILTVPMALQSSGGTAGGRFSSDSASYAAQTRDRSQTRVLAALPSHPLGWGLGATGAGGRMRKASSNVIAVDNLYFATLYETGIPGVVILLLIQGTILVLTIRCAAQAKVVETRAVYIGMASAQVAMLVNGIWSQGAFDYAPVSQIFWLFAGAVALPKRVEGEVV
ncbi:MAG: O-antigen ligase family protein [Vulcanimicrobiaceae bacterium]